MTLPLGMPAIALTERQATTDDSIITARTRFDDDPIILLCLVFIVQGAEDE